LTDVDVVTRRLPAALKKLFIAAAVPRTVSVVPEPELNALPLDCLRVPDEAQASVAPPAAMFLAGVAAENFGVEPVLLTIAGFLVLTALGVLRVKSLRDIDTARA